MNDSWEMFLIGIASAIAAGLIIYFLRRFFFKPRNETNKPFLSANMPFIASFVLLGTGALLLYLGAHNDEGGMETAGSIITMMSAMSIIMLIASRS